MMMAAAMMIMIGPAGLHIGQEHNLVLVHLEVCIILARFGIPVLSHGHVDSVVINIDLMLRSEVEIVRGDGMSAVLTGMCALDDDGSNAWFCSGTISLKLTGCVSYPVECQRARALWSSSRSMSKTNTTGKWTREKYAYLMALHKH
jgi:hypothetical protein